MRKKRGNSKAQSDLHKPLRKAMEDRGWTELDLAAKSNLSVHAVRLVLTGSPRATLRALASVACSLGFRLNLNFYKPSLLEKLAEAAACDDERRP